MKKYSCLRNVTVPLLHTYFRSTRLCETAFCSTNVMKTEQYEQLANCIVYTRMFVTNYRYSIIGGGGKTSFMVVGPQREKYILSRSLAGPAAHRRKDVRQSSLFPAAGNRVLLVAFSEP